MDSIRRIVRTFGLVLACLCGASAAGEGDPIRVLYFAMPPYVLATDEGPMGPQIDMFRVLTQGLPVEFDQDPVSMSRAHYILTHERSMIVGLGKIPERAQWNLAWIGEVFVGDMAFATRRGHAPVNTVDQAKDLDSIGCNEGGAPALMLEARGFKNIDLARSFDLQAAKLKAGRIEAWFDLRTAIVATWKRLGYPEDELVIGVPVNQVSMWVAASPLVDPATIAALQQRFETLKVQKKVPITLGGPSATLK